MKQTSYSKVGKIADFDFLFSIALVGMVLVASPTLVLWSLAWIASGPTSKAPTFDAALLLTWFTAGYVAAYFFFVVLVGSIANVMDQWRK